MSTGDLTAAKKAKQDEFYTQRVDVERELVHYRDHFAGKVVYCNCDDPRVSAFFHYFSHNFELLGLKRLITTCFKSQERDLFSTKDAERAICLQYEGDTNGNRVPDPEEIGIELLKGDGDFLSTESIELLEQADIVVTNPPYSLFKEYINQLVEYDKDFLVLSSQNKLTLKSVFKLLKEDKAWLGYNSGNMEFRVPDHYPPRKSRYWVDEDGQKWRSFGNMCWLTNLDLSKRHEELVLYKRYDAAEFPTYVNYDAIDVVPAASIPMDYPGAMGVPITFLTKHNPDQFEILGSSEELAGPIPGRDRPGRFYLDDGNGNLKRKYERVVIRNRKL
jgi:hypothetical protein